MASSKKRRKEIKITRKKQKPGAGPFRHPDGDRRHRGGPTYEQVLAQKRALQQAGLPPMMDEEEE